jgi:hypothetical protein
VNFLYVEYRRDEKGKAMFCISKTAEARVVSPVRSAIWDSANIGAVFVLKKLFFE